MVFKFTFRGCQFELPKAWDTPNPAKLSILPHPRIPRFTSLHFKFDLTLYLPPLTPSQTPYTSNGNQQFPSTAQKRRRRLLRRRSHANLQPTPNPNNSKLPPQPPRNPNKRSNPLSPFLRRPPRHARRVLYECRPIHDILSRPPAARNGGFG